MYGMEIQTGELRATDLPTSYGGWSDYVRFALTFDPKDRELCREVAGDAFARWQRTGEVPRRLEERWRFLGREPDREGMRYAGALIRAMRAHL